MCGAFSLVTDFKLLSERFDAALPDFPMSPRFNARPTQMLPVILNTDPDKIQLALWGIIPPWAGKDKKIPPLINTRKESLETKPIFNRLLHSQRCLILSDGFYEWQATKNGKQPFRFELKNHEPFAFAGIWQMDKQNLPTFSIITTTPNQTVGKVHDRMPAILPLRREKEWLRETDDLDVLMDMIGSFPDNLMDAYPVSKLVNSAKNDSAEILKAI